MDIRCSVVVDGGCDFVLSAPNARHLAAEIVAHTHHHHDGSHPDETAEDHYRRLTARLDDLLTGGAGTAV